MELVKAVPRVNHRTCLVVGDHAWLVDGDLPKYVTRNESASSRRAWCTKAVTVAWVSPVKKQYV
jgi:hypothetical protein